MALILQAKDSEERERWIRALGIAKIKNIFVLKNHPIDVLVVVESGLQIWSDPCHFLPDPNPKMHGSTSDLVFENALITEIENCGKLKC